MASKSQYPKILIVDDVAINVDVIKSILQAKNYLITYVNNGQSALDQAKINSFDLILLNNILSDFDGFEICRQIKEETSNSETPVIFLTEHRDEENLIKGFNLGAVDYLQKPFSGLELLARIKLHLSLKKTQEELIKAKIVAENAAKAKSLFLANMSHEIRTPLNGIVGMVDVLNQTQLNKQQRDYLEIIGISTETLLMIINDILDFSKIDSGQIAFERIKFNLYEEVNDVYKLLSYKTKQKKLDFSLNVADDVPELVMGDPLRIKQVLINLINNAIKFTDNGHVHVNLSLKEDMDNKCKLKFEVVDSGIGISPDNQGKLFQYFSQADVSTTRKFGGTGLGLAISKRLSELMNGEIGVESEEGKGSAFWFTAVLDKAVPDMPRIEVVAEKNDTKNGRKLHILMAEDNVINQKVSALNIQKLGYDFEIAPDGITAVEMFGKDTFDLILMDIHMPKMDGLEATMEIRRLETEMGISDPIPIIAMTSNIYKDDIPGFMTAGMTDHLGKPFKLIDLKSVIEKNMNGKLSKIISSVKN